MKTTLNLSLLAITIAGCVFNANGHGRLLQPPSRSSMWRYAYSDPILYPYRSIIQPNYDDNGLNCGGKQVQNENDGKCGVCGDPYPAPVKENEAGGKYALGIITRIYNKGDFIDATVEITAEHKGYFEFRLCPWNNVEVPVTHECLNQHLLTYDSGDTKWYLPEDSEAAKGMHYLRLKLPNDVTCEQCVLQWRYRTGNSWGYEDGKEGLGLGQQEEFYGCSDIAVKDVAAAPPSVSTTTSAPLTTSTTTISTKLPVTTTSLASGRETSSLISTIVNNAVQTKTSVASTTTNVASSRISTEVLPSSTLTSTNEEDHDYSRIDCSKQILGQPIFRDCHSFYVCAFPQHDPFTFSCPKGTVCNPENAVCDHPYNVPAPCNSAL
ncbi:uncharacterized protein LOC143469315 [Clavelina lepadiformis]|uniref:uncharacterized protein LOC143469315 n=1 Tax=Clavelina lepadiformis TaxID=159417 RepID=UPI0040428E8E